MDEVTSDKDVESRGGQSGGYEVILPEQESGLDLEMLPENKRIDGQEVP